jgi:hypothetical protein
VLLLLLQVQGINIQQTLSASEDPLLLCWSTTGFLLLLLGLLLPAPVWYCLELRSRGAFYKLWQQQQQQQQRLRLRQQQQQSQRLVSSSAAAAAAGAAGGDESSPLNPVGRGGLGPLNSNGTGFSAGEVFEVHLVSLCMVLVALTACSCLLLMSCGPQLLWLQLQLL